MYTESFRYSSNFGVNIKSLQVENNCNPPPPPQRSQYFRDGINLQKDKSFFLNKPVTIVDNQIILPFKNSEDFFRYNYYNDGRLLNYGGLTVRVFFLPSNISNINDVKLYWVKDDDDYDEDDVCYFSIKTDPIIQNVDHVDIFRDPLKSYGSTINAKVNNIGNYTSDTRLFVTVRRRYSSDNWLGSFYI
jgi:hypothetical protein